MTDNIQARTTERIGPLFSSPESQVQVSKNNFNEVIAVSFITLALVIVWRLDLIGLDIFQSLTLGIGLSVIVPLIGSEISGKREEFEIWKLTSTIAWIAIILSILIGVKFSKTNSELAELIFPGEISESLIAVFLFIICASIWLSPIQNFDARRGVRNLSSPVSLIIFTSLIIVAVYNPTKLLSIDSSIIITGFILMMVTIWAITNLAFGKSSVFVYGAIVGVILFHLKNGESTVIGNSILPVAAWGLTIGSWDYDEGKIKPVILIPALLLHYPSTLLVDDRLAMMAMWLILWFFLIIYIEVVNRVNSPPSHNVLKILPPQRVVGKTLDLDKTIAIVGAKESGKSCYLGALWTSLNNNLVQELWYNSGERYNDGRDLPFPTKDIEELLQQVNDGTPPGYHSDKEEILQEYLKHRSAKYTMKEEIESGTFPNGEGGFPFTLSAEPKTRRFLDGYMEKLASTDIEKRKLLMATASVDTNLQFSLEFVAEIEESKPLFFGIIQHSVKSVRKVNVTFRTMDLPGEDVTSTLDKISGKNFTSRSVDELLYKVKRNQQKFGAAVEYNLELLSVADNVLYIVDADKFTSHGGVTQREVESYVRLANNISGLEGSKVKNLTLLLNKADLLLNRSEQKTRLMKGGGLDDWDSMLNTQHSMSTVEEVLGLGILQDIEIELDSYYSCTLGGLINNSKNSAVPTYPMVPVNVIEPLLRCLLTTPEPSSETNSSTDVIDALLA